jgi:CheY-like chemotaxis protein
MRVLVVEDEPRMAELLRRGLAEDGFFVDVVDNGHDGLWHALEFQYDALVLDVMLPKMSGIEVCHQLRQQQQWAPVLLLTARDAVLDQLTGITAGADDYLVKPFSFAELSARVARLARRGAVAGPQDAFRELPCLGRDDPSRPGCARQFEEPTGPPDEDRTPPTRPHSCSTGNADQGLDCRRRRRWLWHWIRTPAAGRSRASTHRTSVSAVLGGRSVVQPGLRDRGGRGGFLVRGSCEDRRARASFLAYARRGGERRGDQSA